MIIDTHAHLYWDSIQPDIEKVIQDFQNIGGVAVVNVACDVQTFYQTQELQKQFPNICKSTIGLHPVDAQKMSTKELKEELQTIEKLIPKHRENIIALGEIGFDYHWLSDEKDLRTQQIDTQVEAFFYQADLAKKHNLPTIIHTRNCTDITLDYIQQSALKNFVIHCFGDDRKTLEKIYSLSDEAHISLTGSVTYPKNEYVREALISTGIERVMIETDSPFLPPQKYRSRVSYNEPKYLKEILKELAICFEMTEANVEEIVFKNSCNFFRLDTKSSYS